MEICDQEQAYDSWLNYENNKWNTSRYNKPQLRYYSMYKYSLETENYLFFNISKYHRSLFAQFRAGILTLKCVILSFIVKAFLKRKRAMYIS